MVQGQKGQRAGGLGPGERAGDSGEVRQNNCVEPGFNCGLL